MTQHTAHVGGIGFAPHRSDCTCETCKPKEGIMDEATESAPAPTRPYESALDELARGYNLDAADLRSLVASLEAVLASGEHDQDDTVTVYYDTLFDAAMVLKVLTEWEVGL